MKTICTIIALFLLSVNNFAQTETPLEIKMRSEYGSKDIDVMSILHFENIALSKMIFTGEALAGKDFQIDIKRFDKGKLTKTDTVFDSKKEGDYFKVKGSEFTFRLLNKITPDHKAKFQFQFRGFSVQREYEIDKTFAGFVQKDFGGDRREIAFPIGEKKYFLTYIMPYEKPDGSKQYCEVVQSGISPDELGTKYAIPTYFLVDIRFD